MYRQEQIKPYGNEGSKREQVERMFDHIAHTYDRLNHTLSFGVDRLWRNTAIDTLKPYFPTPVSMADKNATDTETGRGGKILDVATGTGDFAILAYRKLKVSHIVGCDISESMMDIGRKKVAQLGLDKSIVFRNEDCAAMSFDDHSFDAIISAFALRNFQDLDKCLQEMHRVLADGGHLSIIDLCAPVSFPMKQLFHVYQRVVMPVMGWLLARDKTAYTYLPQTMAVVPQGEQMQTIIEAAGFRHVAYKRLAFGMCMLYTAVG